MNGILSRFCSNNKSGCQTRQSPPHPNITHGAPFGGHVDFNKAVFTAIVCFFFLSCSDLSQLLNNMG